MAIDDEIKELREQLTKAWEFKLKSEGYRGLLGVGGEHYAGGLAKRVSIELNKDYMPGEIRIIHDGVFGHPRMVGGNNYSLYRKQSWDIAKPDRKDFNLRLRGSPPDELSNFVYEKLTNFKPTEMRIIHYGIINKHFKKRNLYSVYVNK